MSSYSANNPVFVNDTGTLQPAANWALSQLCVCVFVCVYEGVSTAVPWLDARGKSRVEVQ